MNTGRSALAVAIFAGLAASALGGEPDPCGGFVGPARQSLVQNAHLAVADFNRDGRDDLVAGSGYATPGTVSVYLGSPAGFEPSITTPLEFEVGDLAAGRFDADDDPDLVVVSFGSVIAFLKGNGDGTFEPPVTGGFLPTPFEAADVDGNGTLDLAAAIYSPQGEIRVALGLGNGAFGPQISSPILAYPTSIAFGDVNGDDVPDAAVGGFHQEYLAVHLGLGDGSFGTTLVLATDLPRYGVQLLDLDRDGDLDLVASAFQFALEVRLGHGDGTFESPSLVEAGPFPFTFAAGDLNGDGILDLTVGQGNGNTPGPGGLQVVLGNGDGTFDIGESYVSGWGGSNVLGDYDGDGRLDAALGPASVPEIWLMRGRGDGTLVATPYALYGSPSSVLVGGDFDGEGGIDLAVTGFDSNFGLSRTRVATSGPDGFTTGWTDASSTFFVSGVAGDFRGIGRTDLVYLGYSEGVSRLETFPGNGDATFGSPLISSVSLPNVQSYPMLAGRFDAGPSLDLAVATSNGAGGGTILTFLGAGDGTFVAGPATTIPTFPIAMATADLDGDGYGDLVVPAGSGRLYVLRGAGDGTFAISPSYAIHPSSTCVFLGDVDGDGATDVLVGDYSGAVSILRGQGDGTLAPRYAVGVGQVPLSGVAADFNLDGYVDLLTSSFQDGKASLLLGYGDGTFDGPRTWVVGVYPITVLAADFDGDGLTDAAVADAYGVAILWNSDITEITVPASSAVVGASAVLTAQGGEQSAPSYAWRRDGVPLSDGGPISGAKTASLTIDPVSFADAGSYDVVVTDECGSVFSNAATLSVEFADVPLASPFHDDILAIATAGIAAGCGGGNYCPASLVRRDQMAVFLLKAEHGSDYTPPPCAGVFDDVPCPGPFADWVEQLAAEGVTGGCGGDNYCPGSSVTRAQMAIFLLKTSEGSGYVPPPATGIFGDVPVGSFGADFIEDLYNRGITGGCLITPLLYCPTGAVLRQQMATFLVRTFFP